MVGRAGRRTAHLALLCCLVVAAATAPATASAGSTDDDIHRTLSLALTPETPGEVAATARYDIPDTVRALETSLPARATVTATDGFDKTASHTYEWDGTTASPSIQFTVAANRSGETVRATRQASGYSFVDAGPWAIVAVPQLGTSWKYVGDRPGYEKTVRVDGAGATGGEIAYLGPHETYERTAHGQRITLVVPAAASLSEPPTDILQSVTDASDTLRVGDRDDHVFLVAAPNTVAWGAAGIEYGGSDAWVLADEPLDAPRNVWLHEYVHTRQQYQPTAEARWTLEASAEYHAALLGLQQRRIDFAAFRRYLDRGTREPAASGVLADPESWTGNTPYLKGALVYGGVDRQVRLGSNGTQSMQAVLSRLNSDPNEVTADDLHRAVAAAGGHQSVRFLERWTTSSDAPDPWSASEHGDAFAALPARISYTATDIAVTGAVRDDPLTPSTVVTTEEALAVTVALENSGGATGTYETTLYVDETAVATQTGTVDAQSTRTVTMTHEFSTPGTYTVTVAGTTREVVVEDPAHPHVQGLNVTTAHDGNESRATITVTLTNPTDRPASGAVPVALDGDRLETIDVTLGVNETSTHELVVTLPPGTHTITAGDTSLSVAGPTTNRFVESVPVPGFGPVAVVVALLLLAATANRHQ